MDATYAGSAGRNLEMYYDLNGVPDGTRFVDLNPAARDPGSTSATAVLPPEFLRPTPFARRRLQPTPPRLPARHPAWR